MVCRCCRMHKLVFTWWEFGSCAQPEWLRCPNAFIYLASILGPHLTFDSLSWLIPFSCFPVHLVQDFPVLKKKVHWIWSLVGGSIQKSPESHSPLAIHSTLS